MLRALDRGPVLIPFINDRIARAMHSPNEATSQRDNIVSGQRSIQLSYSGVFYTQQQGLNLWPLPASREGH